MPHKSGFVNIIGKPNAGKSTLMNQLVGEKLSIITHKAQTTRHRIMGIVTGEDFQIVYSDTPGIVKPNYKLHESMMKYVESALEDADVLVYILDITDKDKQTEFAERIKGMKIPVIVVINKIDQSNEEILTKTVEHWHKALPEARIIPVSALHKFNLEPLIKNIVDLLPESPAFYDKDTLTDKTERFFTSEIIREKIFLDFQQEIPYSAEVIVTEFKDEPKLVRIMAYIFVSRDTQKGIILGHQGKGVKNIGMKARKDLEEWLGKKVFLELSVKVKKDWRNDEKMLRRFGYGE